eukprot:TRINITY_DN8503_c0_g1_i1.p1 TRINITY_DN8503_c0_g1~~TRINITY_DN8503_c0_g1_i1.p1  ORF type:complete len:193 (+),score=89.97 TRINITY_DN8503_c0_g1_i1:44-622(+)
MATQDEIKKTIRSILEKSNIKEITAQQLRRKLEEELELEEYCLDAMKEKITAFASEIMKEMEFGKEEKKEKEEKPSVKKKKKKESSDEEDEVPEKPAAKKVKEVEKSEPKPSVNDIEKDSDGNQFFNLSSNYNRITVKKHQGVRYVDIRKFFKDKQDGTFKPERKGISLNDEMWESLKKNIEKIDKMRESLK